MRETTEPGPLVAAVLARDGQATAQALRDGADPDTSMGRFRGSVLELASSAGATSIVELLLDAGAHIGPSSDWRASSLQSAVRGSHLAIVRLLLARGALALEDPTKPGVLAIALSAARHRPTPTTLATLRELLAAGVTPDLVSAVTQGVAPAVLRILLEYGTDPNETRSDGTPVLVLAARRGDHAAVDALIQSGAAVDAADTGGRTALMHAVERDHKRCAAVLLLAGADIATTTGDGTNALQLARGWQRQNIQFMLGVHRVGLDNVPITRTTMRVTPTGVRLAGDPPQFELLADVIDLVVSDLRDDEWRTRTGTPADAARRFAIRLRTNVIPAGNASWHYLDADRGEYAVIRGALLELAYGTTRSTPPGYTRLDIIDLFEELR
jgi:ankyrin repeat protein